MAWKRMLAYVTGEVDAELLARIEYLIEENRVLRDQITKRILLTDAQRRVLAEKAVVLGRLMADTVSIVRPDTILRWHRQLVARKFDGTGSRKCHGRPRVDADLEHLVVAMATDNPCWGYDRIAGALKNLGYLLSDQTVGNILRRNGIAPSPERRGTTTWTSFIRAHRETMWASDFFTTEIWTRGGLTTFYVLFFINIATREIALGGLTKSPNGEWMLQVGRNITSYDGELASARYLIHDRDGKYTTAFDDMLSDAGIQPVRLPPRSPNLNPFAERSVRSIKSECLDRMIVFGERMLRHVVKEYLAHYHAERNHQGIGNTLPFPDNRIKQRGGISKSERLGGLLQFYHRAA